MLCRVNNGKWSWGNFVSLVIVVSVSRVFLLFVSVVLLVLYWGVILGVVGIINIFIFLNSVFKWLIIIDCCVLVCFIFCVVMVLY